jgi:hypothetical protein
MPVMYRRPDPENAVINLSTIARRRAATVVAVLGAASAVSLGIAPAANAMPLSESFAEKPIQLTITHEGNYSTTLCAGDILEARCQFDIVKNDVTTFTVTPRELNNQISVRVSADGGGSAELSLPGGTSELCFTTAGSRDKPTITQVDCPA